MERTPFSYVFEAGRGFRRPASSSNPTVRAATLAGATVGFIALLLLIIPLIALFLILFAIFWVIAKVGSLFSGAPGATPDDSQRENVRVVGRFGDQSPDA